MAKKKDTKSKLIPITLAAIGLLLLVLLGGWLAGWFTQAQPEQPSAEVEPSEDCRDIVYTWPQIKQLKGRDEQLRQYYALRDCEGAKKPDDLIQQAMAFFNGMDKVDIRIGAASPGRYSIGIGVNGQDGKRPNINLPITNLDALKGLDVASVIMTSCPNITDFEALRGMDLATFKIPRCKGFSDASVLADMPGLRRINLFDTGVTDLRPLMLKDVDELRLGGNPGLTSLDGLEGMTARLLIIDKAEGLLDISALSQVKVTEHLHITFAPFTDLSPIKDMPLQRLTLLSTEGFSSLSALDKMSTLKLLFLRSKAAGIDAEVARIQSLRPDLEIRR